MAQREVCFACGRRLGKNPTLVTCVDEQDVFVGSECAKMIDKSGATGWQPPRGGPRLYSLRHDPKHPAGQPYLELCARMDRARRGLITKQQQRQIDQLSRLLQKMGASGALEILALQVDTGGSISDISEAASILSAESRR